ncbi:MAG: YdiU family protein [Chromatocurvus sp.]
MPTLDSVIPFDNSYARLPPRLYAAVSATPVASPELLRINVPLCEQLGIDAHWLASPDGVAVLAGNALPEGAAPIATVYAGHQFGQFNPQLGDGRALLLGEVVDRDGKRFDLQLKGSGRTPYSRSGDGRSPLGPVVREYLVSEAMHALGVPSTRALAAVTTGERVIRSKVEPGAILARVASSHIRIGTFQFFAAREDLDALRTLVDHVLARHYPEAAEHENPALAMLEAVIARQAALVAHWQHLGFVHGVMNTDNMLLCGETVDYGPCAFIEGFQPDVVFSSIDYAGRYAYRNQPGIAHWNLARLAETLVPLIADDKERAVELARASIETFPGLFSDAHAKGLASKLGLSAIDGDDATLVEDLFDVMAQHRLDFTLTFRYLSGLPAPDAETRALAHLYSVPADLDGWLERWMARLASEKQDAGTQRDAMRRRNPLFIPRNHLVQRAISAAESGDHAPFNRFAARFVAPFGFDADDLELARPALPEEAVQQTFCGT